MRYNPNTFTWEADNRHEIPVVGNLNMPRWARQDPNGLGLIPSSYVFQPNNTPVGGFAEFFNARFQYAGFARNEHHFMFQRAIEEGLPDAPELDLSSLLDTRPRKLPPFKVIYDTTEEARLRLNGTVVMLRGKPFSIDMVGGTNEKIKLLVSDSKGKKHQLLLQDVPDLRTCSPRYFAYDGHAYYLCRFPARAYQQGLTTQNTYAKMAGSDALSNIAKAALVEALEDKKVLPWADGLDNLLRDGHIRDLRLSEEVSVYRKKTKVFAEYRGRDIGHIKENVVFPDFSDDQDCPWIKRALDEVSMKVNHV